MIRRLQQKSILIALCSLAALHSPASEAQSSLPKLDEPSKLQKVQAVDRGVRFLAQSAQQPDGSFVTNSAVDPGISALAVTALLRNGRSPDDPTVAKGLKYLESFLKPDGGIYRDGTFYRNYETSICVMGFAAANADGRYDELLKNAEAFVKAIQWDQGEGITENDMAFGGAGYGKHKRPDLSNTQFLIDALRAVGNDGNSESIQRALIFVSRCQNLESTNNTSAFAGKNPDGGFYYSVAAGGSSQAGETDTGGLRSYGSMTYAGLKSMIYAGLTPDDERVQAAIGWIADNYDLDSNPGMGQSGLFYYYHTFAKALSALGRSELESTDGTIHDWRKDLISELASRQRDDGSFLNDDPRWLENDKSLVTAYALLALSYCE